MEIALAPNQLCTDRQTLTVDKVATLIGENGCGKSTILHSIFNSRITGSEEENGRLICFTSGQNENFSGIFSNRINRLRKTNDISDIDFGCLYFTKRDVRSLVFLATTFVPQGLVRSFLGKKEYIKIEDDLDKISTFSIPLEIPINYLKTIKSDEEKEALNFDHPSIRKRPFNQRLESFIDSASELDTFETILEKGKGIKSQNISFTSKAFFNCFDGSKLDATKFLVEGAYNGYFLDADGSQLRFNEGLEFEELSDGEYQMLFLYSLIDLFDSENTLFLLDEADSHLHYTNVKKLWRTLRGAKGQTITTSHLLESISTTGINNIHLISKGRITDEDKFSALTKRLDQLGYVQKAQFKVCSLIENIVLIDDPDDWVIFKMLAERKLERPLPRLNDIQAIKKESNYEQHTCGFGKSKIAWADAFSIRSSEWDIQTKNIFLICDRDNLPLASIDTDNGVSVNGENAQPSSWSGQAKPKVHLLSWRHREIENYLLSHTALIVHNKLPQINAQLGVDHQLNANVASDSEPVRCLDVKEVIKPIIKPEEGLCLESLQEYINLIPPSEISEDITNMYNFIIGKL